MVAAPSHGPLCRRVLALAFAAALGCSSTSVGDGLPVNMSLSATVVSSTQIALDWSGASGAMYYQIYSGSDPIGGSDGPGATVGGLRPRSTHCFTVIAVTFILGATGRSNQACATTADDHPPAAPGTPAAVVASPIRVDLTWPAAVDDWGVVRYDVLRDGLPHTTARGTSLSDEVLPASTHCYTVTATDTAGTTSPPSPPVCATTPADTTPPTMPPSLSVSANGTNTVTLAWSSATDDARVAGYRVYRDGALALEIGPTLEGTADPGLRARTTYCYQVTAVDEAGNESLPTVRRCVTTTWRRRALEPQPTVFDIIGERNALVVDGTGALHVLYSVQAWSPDTRQYGPMSLRYGTDASGAWTTSPVADSIWLGAVSLALSPERVPHASYCTTGGPIHASPEDAWGWSREVVSGQTCLDTSIRFDPAAGPVLVYDTWDGVYVATELAGAWSSAVAVAGGTSQPGLAIDARGARSIAYRDSAATALGVATDAGGAWSSSIADAGPGVGWYDSVATDAVGHLHVAYYDDANRQLRYATNASGEWSSRAVDADGNAGWSTSIAVDTAGSVHIAYRAAPATGGEVLRYATNAGGEFVSQEIDYISYGVHGPSDTSIAIGPDGRVHILYHWDGLRYATDR